ncbi:juvenile hormone esterase-like [Musca autumnalis]|uniref:juvenile hormone esterase-like n=1 Tax=Musca autumnalis TaxID=221902 RepID=UPI003CE6D7F0
MSITLGIFIFIMATGCYAEDNTITVDTTLGAIKGIEMETRFGNKFWSFRGIRYAEPPLGELRFKNPQPIKAWQPTILDATNDGPMCPQVTEHMDMLSEDCLHLNVYTKNVNSDQPLNPVIVFIHPGGFHRGTGISVLMGPQYFMERDIVLVTFNYRLGSLGFLATDTEEASGNMGLKDQVLVLRWIREHIEKFGGDPNSVTLWGYSAGSFSVGLHILSPMSKGLFHRAIMQSASPLGHFTYENNQMELAEKQAKLLECPVAPVSDMIKCLKEKPMLNFVNTAAGMFESNWNPIYNWFPVVESDFGQERFLTEDPYKTMMSGNFNKVPLIIGLAEYEMYFFAYHTLLSDEQRQHFISEFDKYAPIYFLYERGGPKSSNISQQLESYYFGTSKQIEFPKSVGKFAEVYSDSLICYANYRFLQMIAEHVPVYNYLFKYKGRYNYFKLDDALGANHLDELLYLFYSPLLTPIFTKNDPENEIIERLTRMWYEFAKNSDPNNQSDEYLKDLQWPLYRPNNKEYLEMGNNEVIVKTNDIFSERMTFWDTIFPLQEVVGKF